MSRKHHAFARLGVVFAAGLAFFVSATLSLSTAWAFPDAAPTTPKCKTGFVWSNSKKKCVRRRNSSLTDKDYYLAGKSLALAGQYHRALVVLLEVKAQNHAGVLTYIGYANRKLGAIKLGISYYHKALAIAPNNLKTREYLGEGYVAAGALSKARDELAQIAAIGGPNTPEFLQLAAVISGKAPGATW